MVNINIVQVNFAFLLHIYVYCFIEFNYFFKTFSSFESLIRLKCFNFWLKTQHVNIIFILNKRLHDLHKILSVHLRTQDVNICIVYTINGLRHELESFII